jgi:hypothetical protein
MKRHVKATPLTVLFCVMTTGFGGCTLWDDDLTVVKSGDRVTVTCRQALKVFSIQFNKGREHKPYQVGTTGTPQFLTANQARNQTRLGLSTEPITSVDCQVGQTLNLVADDRGDSVTNVSIKTDKGLSSY